MCGEKELCRPNRQVPIQVHFCINLISDVDDRSRSCQSALFPCACCCSDDIALHLGFRQDFLQNFIAPLHRMPRCYGKQM